MDIINTSTINMFSMLPKIFETYFCGTRIFNVFEIILYPSRGNKGRKFSTAKNIFISFIITLELNIYANIIFDIGPEI